MTQMLIDGTTELALEIPKTLAQTTQDSLRAVLEPIFGDARPLCVRARTIVVSDESDKQGMKIAADTRKAIKAIRVAAEKKRKELKEDALRTGQAIDGIFRPFDTALTGHEEYLEAQEKFAERAAAERLAQVKASRDAQLVSLGVDPLGYNTVMMTDESFSACVAGINAQRKAEAEARVKLEQERIAKEKADAEERERTRVENERLKAEAQAREKAMQAEREAAEKARREAEATAKAERDAIELRARREREAIEAKAAIERKAREKAEAELWAKQESERMAAKVKADQEAAEAARMKKKSARAAIIKEVSESILTLLDISKNTADGFAADLLDGRVARVTVRTT